MPVMLWMYDDSFRVARTALTMQSRWSLQSPDSILRPTQYLSDTCIRLWANQKSR